MADYSIIGRVLHDVWDSVSHTLRVAIDAAENHIGQIGGTLNSVAVEITRPADTTAYAPLEVIGANLAVTGATNATPIVVTTATHGLVDGDPITIASVGGNTNANVLIHGISHVI